MNKLYILMGCPGSGKSSFIKNHIDNEKEIVVSRDKIRLSLIKEDDEYFKKEKEVFKKFASQINNALKFGLDVYADATHLNKVSRNKLLRAIDPKLKLDISVIWIKTPLEECISRNNKRTGRAFVPIDAIQRMYNNIEKPELEEGFNTIYIVEDGKPIQVYKEEKEYDEVMSIN